MATKKESIYPGYDAPASMATLAGMNVGDTFEGYLDGKSDVDWIKIDLVGGKAYDITLTGKVRDLNNNGVTTDTVNGVMEANLAEDVILEIRDSKGGLISSHDDIDPGNGDLNARILGLPIDTTGTYYIVAKSFADNPFSDNSGLYEVQVSETDTDINGSPDGNNTRDRLIGTGIGEKIKGKDGDDDLQGLGGDDKLYGGTGNDLLTGGMGADVLDGGEGIDTISYKGSASAPGPGEAITISLFAGSARGGDAQDDKFKNVESVIGAKYAPNTLTGDREDNRLEGGDFVDTLSGGRGDDTLIGHSGNDTLDGGTGDDSLNGGAGEDMLTGGDGDDTVSYAGSTGAVTVRLHAYQASGGDAEGDTFVDSVVADYRLPDEDGVMQSYKETVPDFIHVSGSDNNDVLAGDSRDNHIWGNDGNDRIFGGPGGGDDKLYGGKGDDRVYGGPGDDELSGGPGTDHLHGGPGNDEFDGGDGSDMFYADDKDSTINGGVDVGKPDKDTVSYQYYQPEASAGRTQGVSKTLAAPDATSGIYNVENIIGSSEDDTLIGNTAANVIEGGDGADIMAGGGGVDTLSYESSDRRVSVNLQNKSASGGHAQGDVIDPDDSTSITSFTFRNVIGSDHDDLLTGDSNDNDLSGLAGDDELVGSTGSDTLEGGDGADELDGGTDGTLSLGRDSKADTLSYESSDEPVVVDLVNAKVSGGHADGDEIEVNEDAYDADGDPRTEDYDVATFENVTGSDHNDELIGDHRPNVLDGGAGDDTIRGGDEHGAINDGVAKDADNNVITATSVITMGDTLIGGPGADRLYGGESFSDLNNNTNKDDNIEHLDTASYETAEAGVTVDLVTNRGTAGDAAGDRLIGIEKIKGSDYDDTFIASEGRDIIDAGESATTGPATEKDGDTISYEESYGHVVVDLSATMALDLDGDGTNENYHSIGVGGLTRDGKTDNSANNVDNTFADTTNTPPVPTDAEKIKFDLLMNFENVIGSSQADVLTGSDENNTLDGRGGQDTLTGNDGDDTLMGGDGNDKLYGGGGKDTIEGGSGDDRLSGSDSDGQGDTSEDTFVFRNGEKASDDVIIDFDTGEDTIKLVGFDIDYDELSDPRYVDIFNGNVRINLESFGGGKIILQTSTSETTISDVLDVVGSSATDTDFMIV